MSALISIPNSAPVTMSSLEIAELVGSRHDKVKQSIERLVERGVIVQPPMGDEQEYDALGRSRITKVYNIGKRDSHVIVAQLSPEFTARLVDRWQELEEKLATPFIPKNFAEALRLAADQHDLIQKQQAQIEQIMPSHDALQRIAVADGSFCVTDAAKNLQIRPVDLKQWLIRNGWVYRRAGRGVLIAHSGQLRTGNVEAKVTMKIGDDGIERTYTQARITAKGLTHISLALNGG